MFVVANLKMLILQNICSWITLAFLASHLFLNLRVPSPALAPTPSPTAVAPAPTSTEAKCSTDRWDAVALRGAQQIVAGTQGTMKWTSAMSFTNIVYIYIICIEIPYNYVSNDVYNIWRTYRYSVYIYIVYYIYSVCIYIYSVYNCVYSLYIYIYILYIDIHSI